MSTTVRDSGLGRMLEWAEVPLLVLVPAFMLGVAALGARSSALIMLAQVTLVLVLFFAGYEASRPGLRQVMPTVVLAALAAAGRVLFAAVPDVKPVSAIAIIAGACLGRRNGFMVGALAALTSNFFFGQGMWTPWQMYGWGLIGYLGGALAERGAFTRPDGGVRTGALAVAGALSGPLFGCIVNAFDVIGFVQPLTWEGALVRIVAALPFDVVHGLSTAVFLVVLYGPWTRRIERVVLKFDLRG